MKQADLQLLQELIETTIKSTVNGKIDRLTEKVEEYQKKHNEDMDEIKPFLQGVAGAKVLGSGLKWIAGIAIAYLTIKAFLTGNPF